MNEDVKGSFQAVTFGGKIVNFIVLNDNTIFCDSYGINKGISYLVFKPNMLIRTKDQYIFDLDTYARDNRTEKDYIQFFEIDSELLEELALNSVIYYSTDMAYLYGFNPDMAFDRYQNTRAFKHVKDKSKILTLQKQGIYN